jgi:ABC-2 type transport system permease protein
VVRVGGAAAVGGVSFAVRPGEAFGLLGPNGAGNGVMARAALFIAIFERFMGIGQLIMMPLFVASSALYPLAIMPVWLRTIARANPLTYEVQGLRQMLIGVGRRGQVWLDFTVVIGFFVAMVAAATRAYPRAIL